MRMSTVRRSQVTLGAVPPRDTLHANSPKLMINDARIGGGLDAITCEIMNNLDMIFQNKLDIVKKSLKKLKHVSFYF